MKILQEIKNAIIYTRTAKADCYSTEPQIDICKEFAEHNGYQVIKVFSDEYYETHKDEIDAIIVWRLDRLTCNTMDFHGVIRPFLEKYNIKLLSATEDNDETPEGKLMRNITISIAEFEINSYSKRRKKLSK